ncbi:rod shape-determining protein [Streptomyces boluensis]|uniref:Rod shape-determining protein MreB n=1 Tax=Streptomyces boluensis TaxID=1775135 RepID=A0A964XPF2_9ACTN|nr:rod shape-determining protein [Streptomyces boluensis]NBE54712.1 rod shape-determining protein MreB [Streptomyces boluensis]
MRKARGYAIDLGSATLRILARQGQRVLRMPTVAALDFEGRICARGAGALALQGRRPDMLRLVRPVSQRSVADPLLAAHLLRSALRELSGNSRSKHFDYATLCVPDRISGLQTDALLDVCDSAGLRRVRLVAKSLAAAAGSGIPLAEPAGALVVDVGTERTSAALLSFGDVIVESSLGVGGQNFDTGLIRLMRHRYGLLICPAEAERTKVLISQAAAEGGSSVPVRGQDLLRGLPDTRDVPVDELARVPLATYDAVARRVLALLSDSPPKLVEDVHDRGLVLCGEGARLHGLADRLRERLHVPVHVPDQPGDVGVRGAWDVPTV